MNKFFVFALSVAVLAFLAFSSAEAVTVIHNGVVVVQDDFEGVATGGYPDASIWQIMLADTGKIVVIDDESPGAYEGDQYVKIQGVPAGSSMFMRAAFPTATAGSGAIHAEWMMYIPDPGTAATGIFAFHQPASNRARTYGSWNKVTAGKASTYGGGLGWIDAMPITYDTWQKWEMDMTDPWAETYTISVDGVTSAAVPVWRLTDNLRYYVIGMSGTTSTFYVDAVPEPSTLAMLACGLIVLLAAYVRRRG